MIFDYETLKLIWWVLMGTLLIGFTIADGMDMGVGNLVPFLGKTDNERQRMVDAVAPHWDGNQVWLITAGAAIFAAWPPVYAAAFSGFYLALFLVLAGLWLRPLAFEYRTKFCTTKWRTSWDWTLFAGSFIPSLIFGVAFGNLLQGVPFHLDKMLHAHYDGSLLMALLPLLNPFALLCGLLSVVMITLQGATWLQWREEGTIVERTRKASLILGSLGVVLFALGGVWIAFGIDGYRLVSGADPGALPVPLAKEVVREPGAWLAIYTAQPLAMIAPIAGFAGFVLAMLFSVMRRPALGFLSSSIAIAGVILTAGFSMFPFLLPSSTDLRSSLTVWDATSSPTTLNFMFWAVMIFLPIILAYTVWAFVRMWPRSGQKGASYE